MSLRIEVALGPAQSDTGNRTIVTAPPAAWWPFLYPLAIDLPRGPATIQVDDIHEAFVNHQTGGTRLVTTQPTYLLLAWQQLVGDRDVLMVGIGDEPSLGRHAPEILARRGNFADATLARVAPDTPAPEAPEAPEALEAPAPEAPAPEAPAPEAPAPEAPEALEAPEAPALAEAFRAPEASERLARCVRALDERRTPGALLATASVCMEVNDLDAAARDLDEAIARAPEWAAAHFERGKLWLRLDDMDRASESFRAAAERMPRFAAAWSNLGATLGELDRQSEALEAFTRALACDPTSPQTHNNIGVLNRELGNLTASEAAFRRVLELAPDMAFGYYNLGHTLFLQGRYQAALGAYAEGQRRDPERNPVQASRLAMCRLATGDAAGALTELQRATSALPRDYRQQLLADTHSIAWALLTHRPDLPGWQQVHDWLVREQAR